mgnify:CR=1 FL=1
MLANMKKLMGWLSGALLAVLAGVLILDSTAGADSSKVPGSADDPVVTKSYVDQKIAELRGNLGGGSASSGAGSESKLVVVTVPADKTIYVKAGGELVVRSGKAVAVSSDANGLSDMTDGVDIPPGKPVGNNHLILFPRDGRGVKAAPESKQDLIVLVRGGYEVK